MNKEHDEAITKESQKRYETAIGENRHLKQNLSDTQTNIALLRAELNQMRSQYDAKCYELSEYVERNRIFVQDYLAFYFTGNEKTKWNSSTSSTT